MPTPAASPTESTPSITARVAMARTIVQFGVGVGLVCALWMLWLHFSGNNAFGPRRLIIHFAVPIAAVASQWALRRAMEPAKPGFGRALAVGAGTTVVAAVLAAFSLYGLASAVGESAMARSRAELLTIARAERKNLMTRSGGEAGYQQHLRQLATLTAGDLAQNDFSKVLILGFIFVLPGAVFFRE